MGKKVLGIMVILLFFTGCQNMGNESENLQQVEKQENGEERNSSISNDETETNVTPENDQELSNGEHIRFQLGSQAKIDAIVDMPDKKWNGVNSAYLGKYGNDEVAECVQIGRAHV